MQALKLKPCKACGVLTAFRSQILRLCPECKRVAGVIQRRAGKIVSERIKAGAMRRPSDFSCVDCGDQATGWEHRYYGIPLQVVPTCQRCNILRGPALDVVDLVKEQRNQILKTLRKLDSIITCSKW